ncbi:unnamed protein product [Pelagomonas calceolata]|uniref:F-box domain-containing protein n=1 Tax=Pelagomonas calceolata TaxID=35677 RepID=A0A8J2SAE1_9STRA|nr:unnamed protein product [Pelagomonas calceolata]
MADPGGLNHSLARLKLSLGGNGFEDALAAFVAKARNANERCAEPPLLSELPDDVLIQLLATAPPEAIAALACVAKRYADVCERAGWACAARRFGRRTNAPFGGGGAHWTALAWVPRDATRRPFDEDAFSFGLGALPPHDLADAFFWAEFFPWHDAPDNRWNECLALEATLCHGRVVRDPDGVLDDRAVGPEVVLTGSLRGEQRARRMANASAVRIMGVLRSRVVVLYAWDSPDYGHEKAEGEWPESWDAEDWDETVAAVQIQTPYPCIWDNNDPDRVITLHATYGMDVSSPHAPNALFRSEGIPGSSRAPSLLGDKFY